MAEISDNPSGVSMDLTKIVLNTQYLCLRYAIEHIAKVEGIEAASDFKRELLEAVKSGSIDMALLEDAATYDFVVTMIEDLPTTIAAPEHAEDIAGSGV